MFYAYVTTDHMDSTQNIVYLGQSGLSLPDEAYYREDAYAEIRTAFTAHVAKMFSLAGLADGEAAAKLVLDLETQIASCRGWGGGGGGAAKLENFSRAIGQSPREGGAPKHAYGTLPHLAFGVPIHHNRAMFAVSCGLCRFTHNLPLQF